MARAPAWPGFTWIKSAFSSSRGAQNTSRDLKQLLQSAAHFVFHTMVGVQHGQVEQRAVVVRRQFESVQKSSLCILIVSAERNDNTVLHYLLRSGLWLLPCKNNEFYTTPTRYRERHHLQRPRFRYADGSSGLFCTTCM